MNSTKELLENKILLDSTAVEINELNSNDKILAWNGRDRFEASDFLHCVTNIVKNIYIIKTGDYSVTMAQDHSFWLDNNTELKVTDLIAGESKVYVKENDTIQLRTIESIEVINGEFIIYDVIGSTYKNYILNGFILHNWDPDDYMASKIFGPDHIEVNSLVWSDMYDTAKSTADAKLKALNELVLASIARGVRWNDTVLKDDILNILQNDLSVAIENMIIKRDRFFNSLIEPSAQYSGLVTAGNPGAGARVDYIGWVEQVETPQFSWAIPDVSILQFDIDYTGSTSFTETIWNEHKDATKEFMAASKRVFAKLLNWRLPENNYKGVTPISGFRDDITYNNM